MTLADAATVYAWYGGWRVFRLSPGSKKPLEGTNGFHDATNDITTVARWWREMPNAGIALATGAGSGVWVLDVDAHHGGLESLYALVELLDCEELLNTRIHRTPNGGLHLIYLWPPNLVLGRRINAFKRKDLPGIDLLGNDGYAVLPPTIARNDAGDMMTYTIEADQPPSEAPVSLLDKIREILAPSIRAPSSLGGQILAPPKHGTSGIMAWLAAVPPGGQDDGVSWAVRALRDEGCTPAEAADLLWRAMSQMTLGGRPWAESDVRRHIRSAYGS